jgi:effector-binding domain-containing protein
MRVLALVVVASMAMVVACQQAQEQMPEKQEAVPAKPPFAVSAETWPAKTVAAVTVMGAEVLVDSILPEGVNSVFELTVPKGIQEINGWATEHGYELSGYPIGVFPDNPSTVPMSDVRTEVEWEVAPPAEGELEGTERIEIKTVDSLMVATGVFHGAYDDPRFEEALGMLMKWPEAHGYEVAGPFMEVYHTEHEGVAPQDWKTQIAFPIMPAPQEEPEEGQGE